MRIDFINGKPLDVPCVGNETMWHECYWFAMVKGCSEEECPKWVDKDRLCEIICGGD